MNIVALDFPPRDDVKTGMFVKEFFFFEISYYSGQNNENSLKSTSLYKKLCNLVAIKSNLSAILMLKRRSFKSK